MRHPVFSGLDQLPRGYASSQLTKGCLVLEGGAFRGLYSAGVLDALMTAGINLQCTIGVSAGAMNGVNYVSGQIGRSARTSLRYRHDGRYVGLPAYWKNHGIIGFDFLFTEVEERDPLDRERFFSPERDFIAVATNCLTGRPEYFRRGTCSDIFQAVRASASMPYVSRMVNVDGIPCLDGGCSMKIPYPWALDQGFEKIVVIKTRHREFRRSIRRSGGLPPKLFYHSYPALAESLASSQRNYNAQCDELERLEKDGRLFVLSPSQPVTVSRMEPDMEKLGALYYLGYQDTMANLKTLHSYLAQ